MPEGPEVRRHADTLAAALVPHPLVSLTARTKAAKAWLAEHPGTSGRAAGRERPVARQEPGRADRRRLLLLLAPDDVGPLARLRPQRGRWKPTGGSVPASTSPRPTAILFSAPVFEVGAGRSVSDRRVPAARSARTPCRIPGEGPFDAACFLARLHSAPHQERTIGAALLDQTILAGIGNYLRAEDPVRLPPGPLAARVRTDAPTNWTASAALSPPWSAAPTPRAA